MNDPIKWSELTPRQRDEIIHERIFGLQVEPCQQPDDDEITLSCSACGYRYPDELIEWTDPQEVPYIPYKQDAHIRPIPAYTQSLDAAWLVLQKMMQYQHTQFTVFGAFVTGMLAASGWDGSTPWSEIYPAYALLVMAAQWTPETICLAALKACGVEVEP